MGCHGIAFCYWFLSRAGDQERLLPARHAGPRRQDHAATTMPRASSNSRTARSGSSRTAGRSAAGWTIGSRSSATLGLTYANLHMGNALPTYSETGYGYAVEKAPSTKGWSYPVYEELWNYGFPQEMRHFARCVRGKEDAHRHGRGRPRRDGGTVRGLCVRGAGPKD